MTITATKKTTILLPISANFSDKQDHQHFQELFVSIRESPISQSMHISYDIHREIAEFSTGNWAFCANKSCMETISILQKDLNLVVTNDIDPQNHYFKEIGYKFCKQSQQYFCHQCMDKAVYLTCSREASEGCCCHNVLHLQTEECSCGNGTFDVNALDAANCECECCLFISCDICDKKMCKNCWENQPCCQNCGKPVCPRCTYQEPTDSILQIEGHYGRYHSIDEQCINCYAKKSKNTKECKRCKIKCSLRHNFLPYGFYAENDRLPLLVKCCITHCDTFVCYACGEGGDCDKEDGIYERCIECKEIIYPVTLCALHAEEFDITCLTCVWHASLE